MDMEMEFLKDLGALQSEIKDAPLESEEVTRVPEVMDIEELEKWKVKAEDEARINCVLVAENTMNTIFDNRAYLHPHGLTHYDYSSIPKERRPGLEKFKMKVRHENYNYLHQQADLDALIQLFLRKILLEQPPDPIRFAAEFFAKKNKVTGNNMVEELEDQKRKIERYRSAHPKVKMPSVNSLLMKRPGDLYGLQSLAIQPHAYDFKFEKEKVAPPPPKKIEKPPKPTEKKKGPYCGCKDPGKKTIYKPEIDVGEVIKLDSKVSRLLGKSGEGGSLFKDIISGSLGFTPASTADEDETSTVEGSINYEADDDEEDLD